MSNTNARQLDAVTGGLSGRERQAPDVAGLRPAGEVASVRGEADDWSDSFIEDIRHDVAKNRIRTGRVVKDQSLAVMSNADEIYRRWKLYQETGNRGYLVDAAKYAMWEWVSKEPQEIRQGVCL
jgi:hypothetical protein